MIYAAMCPQCMSYRYRTDDLAGDASPAPEHFTPIAPQVSRPIDGQQATCDACGVALRFVRGLDWATLQSGARLPGEGAAPDRREHRRISTAPAVISELFRVEPGEDVKEMRVLAGDRILVVTSRRIVVVDPSLLAQDTLP